MRYAGVTTVIRTLAVTPGPVRSTSGVEMLARDLKPSSAITTLIVAGGEGVEAAATCENTLAFVRAMAKRGIRIASVCSGAIILAEAGLLDGRRATTHWQRTRQFVATYPNVKLEADQIYTRDGNIWTSAGITAGIDLSLAMVAEDYGDEIAQRTAKQLVLYHRRSGGQSQFSSLLELKASNGRFGPLLAWAREHLDAPLTVEDLAEQAGMSSRHFTRAFMAETGTTPSKAVERLRIEVARQRVQSSTEAIERVAQQTGFRDPERMRRAFIRAFGQPPQSLRRAARAR
jgi:transcriptional regulator GlxA family with amidase domain